MAMELIETIEVGAGGAASIEFTSIPQDGVDLLILFSIRSDYAGEIGFGRVRVNGTDGNDIFLRGTGSAASSGTSTSLSANFNANTATSNTFGNGQIYISNYTASGVAKSISVNIVSENNATLARQEITAGTTTSTDAVTSLLIEDFGDTLMQYSTASLYKIY